MENNTQRRIHKYFFLIVFVSYFSAKFHLRECGNQQYTKRGRKKSPRKSQGSRKVTVQFLDHITKRLDNKFSEILLETPGRSKRGILNGLGSIWKTLTENLDASDGEYYDQCINK
jgi:hypothetical protein